jgi:hypothetical protein
MKRQWVCGDRVEGRIVNSQSESRTDVAQGNSWRKISKRKRNRSVGTDPDSQQFINSFLLSDTALSPSGHHPPLTQTINPRKQTGCQEEDRSKERRVGLRVRVHRHTHDPPFPISLIQLEMGSQSQEGGGMKVVLG